MGRLRIWWMGIPWRRIRLFLAGVVAFLVLLGLTVLGWPKVRWEDVATGAMTTAVSAIVLGLLALLVGPDLVGRVRKEGALRDIAVARMKGVSLRNAGDFYLEDDLAAKWVEAARLWKAESQAIVGRYSKVEMDRIGTLDQTEAARGGIDREHHQMLRVMNATLNRMDDLLARHSPAMF